MVNVGQNIIAIGQQNYGNIQIMDGQVGIVDQIGIGYFFVIFNVGEQSPTGQLRVDYEDTEKDIIWRE